MLDFEKKFLKKLYIVVRKNSSTIDYLYVV